MLLQRPLTNWIYLTVTWIAILPLVVLTFVVLSLLVVAIYRLYLHPLSRIPGPRLAAVTSCWYAYQVRNGRMLQLGKTLHKQYGPVVRVSPNEVWFNTMDAFRVIYSTARSHSLVHSCSILWIYTSSYLSRSNGWL